MRKLTKRKVNQELWKQAKELSKGNASDKIKAINLIFGEYYSLPEDCNGVLKKLAEQNNSKSVRMQIAKKLAKSTGITFGIYMGLIEILSKDPDAQIQKTISKSELFKMTESIKKVADSYAENISRIFKPIGVSSLVGITSKITSIYHPLQNATPIPAKDIVKIDRNIQRMNDVLRSGLYHRSINYYDNNELKQVKHSAVLKKSKSQKLAEKLLNCPKGKKHWKDYEDVCEEILTYCLVGPLEKPHAQSKSIGRLHKRDFVFHIPHGVKDDFWYWIISKYGLAVIVDCKNYSDKLRENDFVITGQYVRNKELTKLGIIITRNGIGTNGRKGQENESRVNNILIICITDEE